MAIRQNTKTLPEMTNSCYERSFEEMRSLYYPKDNDTWCKRQKDKLTREKKYQEKVPIPKAIKETFLAIFKDLTDPEFLEKCLHGQNGNINELLNGIISQKCPKNLSVSRQVLKIGISSAVLQYNDGDGGIKNVMKRMSVEPDMFSDQRAIGKKL